MRMLDGQEIHIPIDSKKMRMLDDQEIHIPIDLLRDILARLPVKTLLRFRCVCKLWCSLIDSKDFHLNTNNRISTNVLVVRSVEGRDQFIFTVRSTDTFKITDHLCSIYESYELLGTCNGLMLMSTKLSGNKVMLRLWNPSIQKSLILPSCPLSSEYEYQMSYLLGCPSSGNNNYKVAAIKLGDRCGSGRWDVLIAVYSFQNHSWSSEIKRKSNVPSMPSLSERLFFQGAWYWIHETHLVSFDFDSEDFSFAELPDVTTQGEVFYGLIFVLGKSLAVFRLSSIGLSIWVMDKDNRKEPLWRPWLSRDSNRRELSTLMSWINGCSEIFYNQDTHTFIIHYCQQLFSYKFSTRQIKTLRRLVRDDITLDTYAESLVLHKGNEAQTLTSFP